MRLKPILLLQAFFIALFFFAERPAPLNLAVPEVPQPELSQQAMRPLAVVQPETAQPVVSYVKTFSFSTGHLPDGFEIDFKKRFVSQLRKYVLRYDFDGCINVSALIFPHHLFW